MTKQEKVAGKTLCEVFLDEQAKVVENGNMKKTQVRLAERPEFKGTCSLLIEALDALD